jgi:antitoxin ParD1/3/4
LGWFLEDMRTTQQFSITPSLDMADAVERKVKSSAYASVSEVVRALLERDAAVEHWLREEVVPGPPGILTHQEYLTDPTKGVPADAVLKRIKSRRGRTQTPVIFRGGHLHAARRTLHRHPPPQYVITHASEAKPKSARCRSPQ